MAYQRDPAGSASKPRGDFIHGVLAHARPAFRAEGLAHARIEQAQEVVAFGGSRHRRAGIAAGILLPDGHRRGDAVDVIHLRLFHALEELPRVRRKRFDVAPLPLGVDGVEGQRRFPRTGHTRDDGQLVMRNGERNVLEVVDPRPANPDKVLHGM